MSQLPEPLVPASVDLQDFAFMPLDVVRLRDSDLSIKASGDEFRAAVLLWCAAWHQIPAGSLPDDDQTLASYTLYGRVVKEWRRVREGALRGWVKCNDGRLYHPVLAEKVHEAWRGKLEQRWRTECARIKKHCQRHKVDLPVPDFDVWMSEGCPQGQALPVPKDTTGTVPGTNTPCPEEVPKETASKGQGEGQGQGQGDLLEQKLPTTSGGKAPPVDGRPPPDGLTPVPDPIFGHGLAFLLGKGVKERGARSFLGAMRKEVGDLRAAELLAKAEREDVSDPIAWLRQSAKARGSKPLANDNFNGKTYTGTSIDDLPPELRDAVRADLADAGNH